MQPRSRSCRHEFKSREVLEKSRLKHRTGNYYRYEDVGNPIDVAPGCPSHLIGKTRMQSGPAVCESLGEDRLNDRDHRDEKTEHRRARNYDREESRWRAISNQHVVQKERLDRMQRDPMLGRKNVTGQPCNIISQAYDHTPQGQQLKFNDDMIKYRGKVRCANISMRNHLGFNPIIGEQIAPITLPPIPRPPPMCLA